MTHRQTDVRRRERLTERRTERRTKKLRMRGPDRYLTTGIPVGPRGGL